MNNSLMGLMIPDASAEGEENKPNADIPLELRVGQMINFDAELWLSKGNSLNVVTDWIKRHDLPEPPEPKWPFLQTLDNIAGAYNSNFWVEGKGFNGRTSVPDFIERYVKEHSKTNLAVN